MELFVDRVSETPLAHRFEASREWWAEWCLARDEPGDPKACEPFVFELRAHRLGEDLYLEGEWSGACDIECARCLKRYRHALRDTFRLVLEPARERTPEDPEGVESLEKSGLHLGDDLEAGWYRGKILRLDAVFAEKVALAMPIQPLCAEDCPGLCPRCGADLSTKGCDCGEDRRGPESESKPNSPFAVLAALRGDAEGKS